MAKPNKTRLFFIDNKPVDVDDNYIDVYNKICKAEVENSNWIVLKVNGECVVFNILTIKFFVELDKNEH